MIIVKPVNQKYALDIKVDDEIVRLTFKQLTYSEKANISSLTTTFKNGKVFIDSVMNTFYMVKYALKDISNVKDNEGNEYKLSFDGEYLTDECVEEILAAKFSQSLILASSTMLESIPDEAVDPLTGKKLEGVEIIPPEKLNPLKK